MIRQLPAVKILLIQVQLDAREASVGYSDRIKRDHEYQLLDEHSIHMDITST